MERDKALAERQYKPSSSKTRFHPNPHDRPKLEDMEVSTVIIIIIIIINVLMLVQQVVLQL